MRPGGIRMLGATTTALVALLGLSATASPPGAERPFEVNVTHGLAAGEPQIAVDPVHHTVVISFLYKLGQQSPDGGRDLACGLAVSRDHGTTWRVQTTHPTDPGAITGDPYHQCSDPTAVAGPPGTVYVGAGWWDTPAGIVDDYDTYISRSTDGGLTWSRRVYAVGTKSMLDYRQLPPSAPWVDRQWLAADPNTGTVYASLADFPRSHRWIVASHDHGHTFGPPREIASGSTPEVPLNEYVPSAARGVLAVSYVTSEPDPTCRCQNVFETSRDDGATWTRRPAPIPATWTAADPSHPGRFAIMNGGTDPTDYSSTAQDSLFVSVTADYGKTWTPVVRIGQKPSNTRLMPWIGYSPTGVLGVTYRTVYAQGYDAWAAMSADGGARFAPPVRISHAVSAPEPDHGADDYGCVALDDKYLYFAWGDMRKTPNSSTSGAERTLYFGRVPLPPQVQRRHR